MSGKGANDSSPSDVGQGFALKDFRTELDVFCGPLDLLLHLVRREELDIFDIPIASITDQYLAVLDAMRVFEPDLAAEFLIMAATLMEIKSRTLLPDSRNEDEEETDPRDELVRQLLQYRNFKAAAAWLAARAHRRSLSASRPRPNLPAQPETWELPKDGDIWALVSAYMRVVHATRADRSQQIVYDDVPVSVYMAELEHRLRISGGKMSFLRLFESDRSRPRLIGMFLALLELVRRRQVSVSQPESAGPDILIEGSVSGPTGADAAGQRV